MDIWTHIARNTLNITYVVIINTPSPLIKLIEYLMKTVTDIVTEAAMLLKACICVWLPVGISSPSLSNKVLLRFYPSFDLYLSAE